MRVMHLFKVSILLETSSSVLMLLLRILASINIIEEEIVHVRLAERESIRLCKIQIMNIFFLLCLLLFLDLLMRLLLLITTQDNFVLNNTTVRLQMR